MTTKRNLRAIVADDDSWAIEPMVDLISFLVPGIHIELVSDGKELVKKAGQGQYDFIITDNQMPRMTGLEAVRKLRENGYTGPVLLYSVDYVGNQALEAGATDFIRKASYGDREAFKKLIEKYAEMR